MDLIAGHGDRVIVRVSSGQEVIVPMYVEFSQGSGPTGGVDVARVPLYSQRDPAWSGDLLGTSRTTVGQWGCVVTSVAALLTYHGASETPKTVNEKARARHGFHSGNHFVWESVGRIWPDSGVIFARRVDCATTPAPVGEIDLYLAAGQPVIAYADFDHEPGNGIQTHFFLVVAENGPNDYLIMDPWHGDLRSLVETYGADDPRRPWMKNAGGVMIGARFYRKEQ